MSQYNFDINFIIHSPFPEYASHIGGVAVAHTLANELTQMGENVYIYANSTDPKYDKVNCIPWGTSIDFDHENTIIIIIAGDGEHTFEHFIPDNLKNASNIVRWLVHNQQKLYPEENKLYMHSPYWNIINGQRIDGHLSVFEIENDIFKDKGLKREGTCYLIKGGLDTEPERAIHKPEDYCIDDVLYNIPNLERRKFMADLFNQKEYFISYAGITFTSVLATMCGCKSIVIPNSSFNKERWMDKFWYNKYGIAFGINDLDRAISTMDKVIPNIENYKNEVMPSQLNNFIIDCYKWLTKKYNL
jgi:hypothetical protein